MGLDEAILERVISGKSEPTLRLYAWDPICLTIGYFQSRADEADLAACERFGIDCIRRTTGGGAVLHEFEVTYSIVAPVGFAGIPANILESYRFICDGIIRGVSALGVKAQFVPLNDIIAGGKKISGNAQTRRQGVVLQHGTILLDVDVEKMFTVLKVPSEKMRDKLVKDVKERVTGLKGLLGRDVGFDEAGYCLQQGFAEALGVSLTYGQFTSEEETEGERLALSKYATREWNEKR